MAVCEMCGREGNVVSADVEGVELKVCSGCMKYGTVRKQVDGIRRFNSQTSQRSFRKQEDVPLYRVRADYSYILKRAREQKNLSQEDFAKLLTEKESLIAKWEAGVFKPDLDVARKLGRILGVEFVERDEDGDGTALETKKDPHTLTLGDFIKIKKRN